MGHGCDLGDLEELDDGSDEPGVPLAQVPAGCVGQDELGKAFSYAALASLSSCDFNVVVRILTFFS